MFKRLQLYLFTLLVPLLAIAFILNVYATDSSKAVNVPVSANPPVSDQAQLISGKPQRIVIPSAGIDLAVRTGEFSAADNSWTLSEDAAHFAIPTAQPNNQQGNTFIYGHNTTAVFGRLHSLPAEAKAYLETDNGRVFEYQMTSKEVLSPSDVSLLEYQGEPVLSLQTCSGWWNEQRTILWFKFIKVS